MEFKKGMLSWQLIQSFCYEMANYVLIFSKVSCGLLAFTSEIMFSIKAIPVETHIKILLLEVLIQMLFGALRSTGLIKKALYSPLLRDGLMTPGHWGQNRLQKYRTWEDALMGAAIKWEQRNFTTHWWSIDVVFLNTSVTAWMAVIISSHPEFRIWLSKSPRNIFTLKQISHCKFLSMKNCLSSVKIVESNNWV